jgi:hypothetical protein
MAMIDSKAPGLDQCSPRATFELDREEAKAVKAFKPGQVVKMTIIGTITNQTFRKPEDPDLQGFEGNLVLDMTDMEIGISSKNAMAELLDDDE